MQYKILNLFVVTTVSCFIAAFVGCRTLADPAVWLVVTLLAWELVQFQRDLAKPIQDCATRRPEPEIILAELVEEPTVPAQLG